MEKVNLKEIVDTTIAMRAREMARNITAVNALRLALPKPAPLTRRQRLARWLRIRWNRVLTAIHVLRGEDIHKDCE